MVDAAPSFRAEIDLEPPVFPYFSSPAALTVWRTSKPSNSGCPR
jgi:hypothetical protein